jgi:Interferon-induced transmembrane protein
MTDHRDRNDATEPDPDADRWSAWLPPLDPTSDHTGAAGQAQPSEPLPQSPGPALPQSSGPPPPPAPPSAQRTTWSYRSAPPPVPPATPPGQRRAVAPQRYLGLSIFATFFGFTPLGIVAIFLSLSVGRLARAGRVAEAERLSRRARTWAIVALVLKLLWTLAYSFTLGS